MAGTGGLGGRVVRGLGWSAADNIALRFGSVITGIALARILSPEVFGIYAVGLTAQTIVQTLADLGLSADLIRHGDTRRRGPTVATLSLIASVILAAITIASSVPVARLLGDAAGAPIIQVLSLTLVLNGLSVVPYSIAQREFMQKQQFGADLAGFLASTSVTFLLVFLGFGAMALAWSRVVGQLLTSVIQFAFTRTVLRLGFNRGIARSALAFGLPLAAGNLLSWMLLNVDYIIVGNQGGAITLGLYVLAFNISSWPSSIVGMTLRSVSFPAFSRLRDDRSAFTFAVASGIELAWAAALPIGFCLGALAVPFITVVYGGNWAAAAAALYGLAIFGVMRVVFDVMASALLATGRSRWIMSIQAIWIAVLAPVMWLGMRWYGIEGAGWAHAIVAVVCIYPLYVLVVRRQGVPAKDVLRGSVWPILAAVPAVVMAVVIDRLLASDLWSVLLGGGAGTAVYAAIVFPRIFRRATRLLLMSRESATTGTSEQPSRPSAVDMIDVGGASGGVAE